MRLLRFATTLVFAAGVAATLTGDLVAQEDLTLPARFRATVMILDQLPPGTVKTEVGGVATGTDGTPPLAPLPGTYPQVRGTAQKATSVFLTIAIDRWTSEEEMAAVVQTLKSGGTYALVSEMEKMKVGFLHVNSDLRWPIQLASTWKTQKGQVVRLATIGSVLSTGSTSRPRSTSPPISIVEFTVPPAGRGDGTLVEATRVRFEKQGRITPDSMTMGTGIQRLTDVERDADARDGDRD